MAEAQTVPSPRVAAAMLLVAAARVRALGPGRASAPREESPQSQLAASREPGVLAVVRYAFRRGRQAIDLPALLAARTAAEAQAATVGAGPAVRTALEEALPGALERAAATHAKPRSARRMSVASRLWRFLKPPKQQPPVVLDPSFDPGQAWAAEWAKQHAAKLAKDLSDTTIADIQDAIAAALADESDASDPFKAAYESVLNAVGDETRAQLITRTETMNAVSTSQRETWRRDGLLDNSVVRVWIAAPDACDECADLDGTTAPLNGTYEDGSDGPPKHPNCRCTEGIQAS